MPDEPKPANEPEPAKKGELGKVGSGQPVDMDKLFEEMESDRMDKMLARTKEHAAGKNVDADKANP